MTREDLITALWAYKGGSKSITDMLTAVEAYSSASNDGKPFVSGSLPLVQIEELLSSLTDDQRLSLIGSYCHGCGSTDKNCQCWNDD